MAEEQVPFGDVRLVEGGFTLPELKWRELVFVGALRREGAAWVRDPDRPMPAFAEPEPFPLGARFELVGSAAGRVRLRRLE